MKKTILRAILLVISLHIGWAQSNFDKTKLDSYFEVLEENQKFMGSVAVSKNGQLQYTKAIGYADLENKVKADDQTKYRIGSISKTFTAVLVLKAVEDNKLRLDARIDKWFPTISNADKITVLQLLNHRSGIHNFTSNADYMTWNTQSKTQSEMIEIIAKGISEFEPDSKAQYSNSNFVLMTFILEKIRSKPYAELLQEQICRPVGLKDTYVFGKIKPDDKESKSYRFMGEWKLEAETDFSIPLGAGAITSTPADLAKFGDALFGNQLLKAESLEIMKTMKDNYGAGLFQVPFYNKVGYGHTGGIDGFSSVYYYFPDSKISYALTSNANNYNSNDISIAVLSAFYDKPYRIPEFTSYVVSSADLDKYLGSYASDQIPLKITISKEGNTLIAQGTGQPALPLEATGKDKFKFDQAKAKFEFKPAENTMILLQGGGRIVFKKEAKK